MIKLADELVTRINELYKKMKDTGLTEKEQAEQAKLRREYIDRMKNNVIATIDSTTFVDEDGVEVPIKKEKPTKKPTKKPH